MSGPLKESRRSGNCIVCSRLCQTTIHPWLAENTLATDRVSRLFDDRWRNSVQEKGSCPSPINSVTRTTIISWGVQCSEYGSTHTRTGSLLKHSRCYGVPDTVQYILHKGLRGGTPYLVCAILYVLYFRCWVRSTSSAESLTTTPSVQWVYVCTHSIKYYVLVAFDKGSVVGFRVTRSWENELCVFRWPSHWHSFFMLC